MVIYTVKSGDTLYGIAERYGADSALIARDNELDNPDSLTVGQALVIRTPQSVHKVGAGENLYSVAQRFGVSVNSLWRNNPQLAGRTALSEGDTLVISDEPKKYDGEIEVNAYVYPSVDKDILRKTLPYLTYLTVFSHGIEENGELGDIDDESVIDLAREYGVSPLMSVSNINSDGFYSPELAELILGNADIQNILIGEIVRRVAERRYGGVSVDFEYVPEALSGAYADFISRLDEKLGSGGYPVFASLAPIEGDDGEKALFGGHDYAALGESADRLMLQSYGWGYMYGEPRAISPADRVADTLSYAVGHTNPQKLFLGMPNYGYNWKLPYISGESRAEGLSNKRALSLASDKLAAIEYDDTAEAPFFKYYDKSGGKAVEHEVHFEDARSVENMLAKAKESGLAGVSVWNAMNYFPQLWLLLNQSGNIKKALK